MNTAAGKKKKPTERPVDLNTGGEKKVKRLRYYIIYKDRREVKDKPCGKGEKKGSVLLFCYLFKVLFLDAKRQRQKYISLGILQRVQAQAGDRRQQGVYPRRIMRSCALWECEIRR